MHIRTHPETRHAKNKKTKGILSLYFTFWKGYSSNALYKNIPKMPLP